MNLFRLLLYTQLYLFFLNVSPSIGDQYRIAYHVVCDGDRLIKLSYNLMIGEAEAYPNYLEIRETDQATQHREARFLTKVCSDEHFKHQLRKYPFLPSLQHGYVMVELSGSEQPFDTHNLVQPVIIR
jgi:hypothetical protein